MQSSHYCNYYLYYRGTVSSNLCGCLRGVCVCARTLVLGPNISKMVEDRDSNPMGHQIQNCLARTVVKAPKSFHITPILRSPHWLKINERIEYKLLSLTYKVLTTSQPDYLHNLISVQSTCRTRSSSDFTLARPSVSSSLQVTNHSFRYASPYLWNLLPFSFRQPHCVHSPPGSPHPTHNRISPHHSQHICFHHLSLPQSFTPDLKHILRITQKYIINHKSVQSEVCQRSTILVGSRGVDAESEHPG